MTTEQIRWQRGNFLKFYAKMKIRIGGASPIEILKDDEFEYDGTILKYAGSEIPSPGVRTAIREGWAHQDESAATVVSAFRPSRNVAAAQTVNRDLSRVQRGKTDAMDTDSLDEETVLDVSDRRPDGAQNLRAQPNVLTRDNNRRAGGMQVNADVTATQDGQVVGRVRSASRISANVLDPNAPAAIKALEERGLGKPEFYERGPKTVHTEGMTIRTNVGSVDPGVNLSQDDEGVEVGRVRKPTRSHVEGIDIEDTSNIRDRRAAAAKKASASASAAKPAAKKLDTKLPPKVRIARSIDPSFPANWSFEGKLAERLAAVKKHGATPEFLEALYAAEGDQMRKQLEKAYPKQFGR